MTSVKHLTPCEAEIKGSRNYLVTKGGKKHQKPKSSF